MTDISNHPICQSCRGVCCVRFEINVRVDPVTGRADWDAQGKAYHVDPKDIAFIKEHFKEIRQPGDAVHDGFGNLTGDSLHQMWFTCTALKDGKCSKYADRPEIRRIHLCSSAQNHGVNPELYINEHCLLDNGQVVFAEHYPGILDIERGGPDMNFVKPAVSRAAYMDACDAELKELDAMAKDIVEKASVRAGIEGGVVKLAEALEARHEEQYRKSKEIAVDIRPVESAPCPSETT